jgi:hypothetical protein
VSLGVRWQPGEWRLLKRDRVIARKRLNPLAIDLLHAVVCLYDLSKATQSLEARGRTSKASGLLKSNELAVVERSL